MTQIQQLCFWVSQKDGQQDLTEITCTPTFTAGKGEELTHLLVTEQINKM